MVLGEGRIVGEVDDLGPVQRRLAGGLVELVADQQCDGAPAELPRQHSAPGDQLERDPPRPAIDELADAPAVVARPRLFRDVSGLLPARCLGCPLREQLADFRGGLVCARDADPCTLGPGVADGEHACRRSGLSEALVVLEDLVDEIGRLPDLDRAVCVAARRLLGREADGDDDREAGLVHLLAEVCVPCEPERVA